MARITSSRCAAQGLVALAVASSVAACGAGSTAAPSSRSATARHAVAPPVPVRASGGSPTRARTQGPGIPALTGGVRGPAHADPAAPVSSPPVRVRIPAIQVDSRLQHLRLEKGGTLQTPSAWQVAGWYAGGVRPGDDGPAVIAGHIDSVNGPAVFYRLSRLARGDAVYVLRKNGSTVRFRVAATAEYPKRTFPTEAVYGPSALPTLRLVTCTGDFDYAQHSYVDNLVVTAYAG